MGVMRIVFVPALFLFFAAGAHADPINLSRPASVPVSGTGLQDAFDSWHVPFSGPVVDVLADQSRVARFTNSASGSSIALLAFEFPVASPQHVFGIYDAADPSKKVAIFDAAATSGSVSSQSLISYLADGSVQINEVPAPVIFATPFDFGFYLEVFSDDAVPVLLRTYYSEDSLNPGGEVQSLVFEGTGSQSISIDPFKSGSFATNEIFFAFESGPQGTEKDFADFVVLVESAIPIPEPTVGLLLGIGAAVSGFIRRRRS